MDTRLQSILENYESMKIGLDDSFSFHCKQCGKCCIHRENTLLNPRDLFRLSKFLGHRPQETVEQYCEVYIGSISKMPIVRLLPWGSMRRCPFLKEQKCSVHAAKPAVCAMYPIGRSIFFNQKDAEISDTISPAQIQYILNKTTCRDGEETHTVREWLISFGIPLDDPFFLAWHCLLFKLRSQILQQDDADKTHIRRRLWNAIILLLYLNYDTTQEFETQFQDNVEITLQIASALALFQEVV